MSKLDSHPTVARVRSNPPAAEPPTVLAAEELRGLALSLGADDAGVVRIGRAELDDQRDDVLSLFPETRSLVSIVCRMNREPVRSVARSAANLEFHHVGDRVNEVASGIVRELERRGVRAVNPAMGFPMEMADFPGKVWAVSHKPIAVAAGLGRMGIHRSVIHPRFGSFVLLGTVLVDRDVDAEASPIDFNPCLDCKLCVSACPVGAIAADGAFNFASCYTHNYREFMGGFTDWVESIAAGGGAKGYRARVTDGESASMWQSLTYGANYKAAYCLAVCPAGEDVIGPFLADRGAFVERQVRPLQRKEETLYVQPGGDAERYAAKRFPHKRRKRVGAVLRPATFEGFLAAMRHVFQPGAAEGLDATYHFRFRGAHQADRTITIRDQRLDVQDGLLGRCDLRVTTDSRAWLRMLRKEVSPAWLLATGRVRLWGDPRLLIRFGKCFP